MTQSPLPAVGASGRFDVVAWLASAASTRFGGSVVIRDLWYRLGSRRRRRLGRIEDRLLDVAVFVFLGCYVLGLAMAAAGSAPVLLLLAVVTGAGGLAGAIVTMSFLQRREGVLFGRDADVGRMLTALLDRAGGPALLPVNERTCSLVLGHRAPWAEATCEPAVLARCRAWFSDQGLDSEEMSTLEVLADGFTGTWGDLVLVAREL